MLQEHNFIKKTILKIVAGEKKWAKKKAWVNVVCVCFYRFSTAPAWNFILWISPLPSPSATHNPPTLSLCSCLTTSFLIPSACSRKFLPLATTEKNVFLLVFSFRRKLVFRITLWWRFGWNEGLDRELFLFKAYTHLQIHNPMPWQILYGKWKTCVQGCLGGLSESLNLIRPLSDTQPLHIGARPIAFFTWKSSPIQRCKNDEKRIHLMYHSLSLSFQLVGASLPAHKNFAI